MQHKREVEDVIEKKVYETYYTIVEPFKPVRSVKGIVEQLREKFKLIVSEKLVALVVSAFLTGRPVLFEGPPGTGKTEVGYGILTLWAGKKAFILPCSENYDEYRVIGDFHPLMAMKMGFTEESFVPRPLLAALILDAGVLVDEIRRSSLRRVFKAKGEGFQVIFTSNPEDIAQGELSDAFLRRVVRIKFTYPPEEVEKEIAKLRLGEDFKMITEDSISKVLAVVNELRNKALHKPGPADTVAWTQMATGLAKLRGKKKADLKDFYDAAFSVLLKRSEDEDLVYSIVEKYFKR
ncbi:MAG: ATPase [Desulfurococcales archaeon ex4484_217_1]|nr:MAG: ATPase [Desulfurococcales archaeon ex4484_217_1]